MICGCIPNSYYFLGVFACEKWLLVSLHLSVSLHTSWWLQLDGFSSKFKSGILLTFVYTFRFRLKSDKNNRYFAWRPLTLMIYCHDLFSWLRQCFLWGTHWGWRNTWVACSTVNVEYRFKHVANMSRNLVLCVKILSITLYINLIFCYLIKITKY